MKQLLTIHRRLPAQGQITVDQGVQVQHNTVVGELDYIPGPLVRFDVAGELGIDPSNLTEIIKKDVNSQVSKGDVLAANSEFYSSQDFVSTIDGYVAIWSKYLGYVYIREPLPTGPTEPLVYTAEQMGMSKLQFASEIRVKDNQALQRGQLIFNPKWGIQAPSLCKVSELSLTEGRVVIKPLFQPTRMSALMNGVVTSLDGEGGCTIKSVGHKLIGSIGFGGEQTGIICLPLIEGDILVATAIDDSFKGCIVVSPGGVSLDALQKLAFVEAAGLLLGYIDLNILEAFTKQDPLTNLGVLMDVAYPIVAMQGFRQTMQEENYCLIKSLVGRRAIIKGNTQLRAGVARPELLIPLDEELDLIDQHAFLEEPKIQLGNRVILIRDPEQGAIGRVSALSSQLQYTSAGTLAVLARVALSDGREITTPVNNCLALRDNKEENS